ncbi:MAG: CcmD family protein [Cytophagales bacterium]|nr:CcmD family protein [Cytophagales bacterium]
MKKINSLLAIMIVAIPAFSQEPEMADAMRSEGKIYVVVAILLLILGGLVAYLVTLDRKVTRLEKKLEENRHS